MWKYGPKILLAVFIATLVTMAATCDGPLRSAISISEDEQFEVTKALLWAKGYPLYEKVWNDQPPLHTVLLGTLFKGFGFRIGVARGLAVFFGTFLLVG